MLEVVTLGDPVLSRQSEPITDIDEDVQNLIDEMFTSMHRGKGIGLAAVQVGHLYRMFITHVANDVPRVFINPEIIETSIEEILFEEGCLSIPGINSDVKRPSGIKVQAWNRKGRPYVLGVEGLLARVVQHENDHLNGTLFIDHLEEKTKRKLVNTYFLKQSDEKESNITDSERIQSSIG